MRIIIHFNKPIFGEISRTIDCESYEILDNALRITYDKDIQLFPLMNIDSFVLIQPSLRLQEATQQ